MSYKVTFSTVAKDSSSARNVKYYVNYVLDEFLKLLPSGSRKALSDGHYLIESGETTNEIKTSIDGTGMRILIEMECRNKRHGELKYPPTFLVAYLLVLIHRIGGKARSPDQLGCVIELPGKKFEAGQAKQAREFLETIVPPKWYTPYLELILDPQDLAAQRKALKK